MTESPGANRLARSAHQANEEMYIVQGEQTQAENLVGDEEMSQVRAGESPAGGAVTVGVDRHVAPPVFGALDVHSAVGCEHGAVAAHPRRSHAIEEVDAPGDTLDQIFGKA